MSDYIIEQLTKLLIQQDIKDRKEGITYIKKVDAYKDVIRLIKELKQNGIFND